MRKIRIKKMPGTAQPKKTNAPNNKSFWPSLFTSETDADQNFSVQKTLQPVPRKMANLEAEKGETVMGDINHDTLPEFFKVAGKKHSQGGTPLSLPKSSFIFSDDKKARIKDDETLKEFGKKESGKGFTPADLSKTYDINEYRKILQDPDSDLWQRETAQKMIENYNMKLGKLALVQESSKGFPQGIPEIAVPYITTKNVDPTAFVKGAGAEQQPNEGQARYGRQIMGKLMKGYFQDGGAAGVDSTNPAGLTFTLDPQTNMMIVRDASGNEVNRYPADGQQQQTPEPSTSKAVSSLPKDASVKDAADPNLKQGDYIKTSDGKYRKVTGFKNELSGSVSGPEGYKSFYGTSIEDDVKVANGRLSELAKQKDSGVSYNSNTGKYDISAQAQNNPNISLDDRVLLTRVSGYNEQKDGKTLGASQYGFKVGTQGYKGSSTGFAGWVTPDLVEYQFWSANNPGKTPAEFSQLPPEEKLDNRKAYLGYLGYDVNQKDIEANLDNPAKLYTPSFVGSPSNKGEGTLVAKMQKSFPPNSFRPIMSDDNLFGAEHADFYRFNKQAQFEDVAAAPAGEMVWICQNGVVTSAPKSSGIAGFSTEAAARAACVDISDEHKAPNSEWWMQDIVKTAGAFGDRMRLKKYMPWAPPAQAYLPEPTFYSPERELAANAEQANIAIQGIAGFAGPQSLSARASSVQGTAAKNAADILSRYNNLNVGVANQNASEKAQILNQVGSLNRNVAQDLYDKTQIVNQQFDNSNAQAREQIRGSYIDAITNRANAQVLNEMYPQYNISPVTGGMMHFTQGRKLTPTFPNQQNVMDLATQYMSQYPGFQAQQYFEAAKNSMGMPSAPAYGYMPDPEYLQNYAGLMSGVQQ